MFAWDRPGPKRVPAAGRLAAPARWEGLRRAFYHLSGGYVAHHAHRPLHAQESVVPTPALCTSCRPAYHAALHAQEDALAAAAAAPNTVDAVVAFEEAGGGAPGARYTIRANHTGLPSTRVVYNAFDILPDSQYRDYWFFANLQLALDRRARQKCEAIVILGLGLKCRKARSQLCLYCTVPGLLVAALPD
jgi:hypothetical protein